MSCKWLPFYVLPVAEPLRLIRFFPSSGQRTSFAINVVLCFFSSLLCFQSFRSSWTWNIFFLVSVFFLKKKCSANYTFQSIWIWICAAHNWVLRSWRKLVYWAPAVASGERRKKIDHREKEIEPAHANRSRLLSLFISVSDQREMRNGTREKKWNGARARVQLSIEFSFRAYIMNIFRAQRHHLRHSISEWLPFSNERFLCKREHYKKGFVFFR